MEQKISRTPVIAATAILSALAWWARSHQLKATEGGAGWLLPALSVVAVALFALYAWFLRGRKKYGAVSSRSLSVLAVSCGAVLMQLIGSILLVSQNTGSGNLLIGILGILTAGCWAAVAVARQQGKRAHAALFLLPTVYYVVNLICQFRFWMRDPAILDYCYDLFALISTMCAMLYLGSYCFDEGKRRAAVFFAMAAVYFSAIAMAGAEAARLLGYLATIVWLLVCLWLYLRPGKKRPGTETEKSTE